MPVSLVARTPVSNRQCLHIANQGQSEKSCAPGQIGSQAPSCHQGQLQDLKLRECWGGAIAGPVWVPG